MGRLIVAAERPDLISVEHLKWKQSDFSKRFHDFLSNVADKDQQEKLLQPFHVHVFISAAADKGSIRVRFEHPPNALSEDSRLFQVFLRTINGLHTSCVKQCLECDEWFFHFTKREKAYCSNKCAARKGNRDRRARIKVENPVAYKKELDENAQRARMSYERKVKAKSNKNVKISRKPRVK